MKLIAIALLLFGSCSFPVAAEVAVPLLIKDNTLIESSDGEMSNGQGPAFFVGRTKQPKGSLRRGLVAFDIAESVPVGSTITGVDLSLHVVRSAGGNEPVVVHRLLTAWGEGASRSEGGVGAVAAVGDATWLQSMDGSTSWQAPGGDYIARYSATAVIGSDGAQHWPSTEALVSDVQLWLDHPVRNHGWILIGDEERPGTAKAFASGENTEAGKRPVLTITYVLP